MKLTEVKQYVRENNLERTYNESMNRKQINSPKNIFSSSKMIDDFFKSLDFSIEGDIDKEINEKITYDGYYKFLSEQFPEYGHFSSFLQEKAQKWMRMEPDNLIKEYDAVIYLLNVFVVSPVNGKIKELIVEKKIRKTFNCFTISNPTPEEDIDECWDLKVENKDITFFLQVKNSNFFRGLKGTSQRSFVKIEKASYEYEQPIFFVTEEQGKVVILLGNKYDDYNTRFIPIDKFNVSNMSQDDIANLSEKTFQMVREEKGITM